MCISQYLTNENTEMCSYVPWSQYEKHEKKGIFMRNTFYGVSVKLKQFDDEIWSVDGVLQEIFT